MWLFCRADFFKVREIFKNVKRIKYCLTCVSLSFNVTAKLTQVLKSLWSCSDSGPVSSSSASDSSALFLFFTSAKISSSESSQHAATSSSKLTYSSKVTPLASHLTASSSKSPVSSDFLKRAFLSQFAIIVVVTLAHASYDTFLLPEGCQFWSLFFAAQWIWRERLHNKSLIIMVKIFYYPVVHRQYHWGHVWGK